MNQSFSRNIPWKFVSWNHEVPVEVIEKKYSLFNTFSFLRVYAFKKESKGSMEERRLLHWNTIACEVAQALQDGYSVKVLLCDYASYNHGRTVSGGDNTITYMVDGAVSNISQCVQKILENTGINYTEHEVGKLCCRRFMTFELVARDVTV